MIGIATGTNQYKYHKYRIKSEIEWRSDVASNRFDRYMSDNKRTCPDMRKPSKLTAVDDSAFEPASIDTVPDKIYDTVVNAILDRALDPGTKLPEDVFCTHFGVSRTIVRVAIHRLQQDKLVDVQRNRGCYVVVPDRDEAADILAARKAIEPFIIRRLVEIATEADLAVLKRHVEQEDEAYHRGDQREALRLSGQFHLLLGELAKSSVIEGFLHNLICRSALVIATYSDVTGCCKAHDHRQLVGLLQKRDVKEAVGQMERHLDDIERDLLQDKPAEEKPSLESVLSRYASGPHKAAPVRRAS